MATSISYTEFTQLKYRVDDLEKEFKDLSEKFEKLSGNNAQQQSSSSPYYNDAMQNRQNIPQRQQGKTKQGGLVSQNYAAEAAKAAAQSSYGNSPQAPTGAAAQAFFLRFPFPIQRDPNDPDTLYTINKAKLPNINLNQYAGYNMLASAISTDEETGCGVFYYNTANPSQTLEAYVQYRIQKYMDESKKKLEEEENLRRRREEEERIKAEEARKKQEEDDRRRKQEEEKATFAVKRVIFNLVNEERSKANARYLRLNQDGKSFSYVPNNGRYIMVQFQNGTRIALPNQVDPFDSSMISDSVYSCNTDYVEDDSICRKYCVIDEDYKITQQGIIEA